MTILPLTFRALTRAVILGSMLALSQLASAIVVRTTMSGHVANITPPLQGMGVQVGDSLVLTATFDDASGVSGQTIVGGTVYFLNTFTFTGDMTGWSGTLPSFLAARHPSGSSPVEKQDWFRPIGTLHHEEWNFSTFELFLITNYAASSGESYGWYRYGSADNISFLLDSVVTSPVPEPTSESLILCGLAAIISLRKLGQSREAAGNLRRDA